MSLWGGKRGVATSALVMVFSTTLANAASSDAIEARLRVLEAEIAKLRREARQAKAEAQQAAQSAQSSAAKAALARETDRHG